MKETTDDPDKILALVEEIVLTCPRCGRLLLQRLSGLAPVVPKEEEKRTNAMDIKEVKKK